MGSKGYKRKCYFIDKDFQTKFIVKFCAIVIISSLLIGYLIFIFSQASTTVAIENTKVAVKKTSDFILPVILETILIVTAFSALAVAILTLFISHKISGPLYRIKREIDVLKEGDLGRNFNIRSKDQLQDLAKSLNEMCICLRQNYASLKEKNKKLKNYLEDKNYCPSPSDKEELTRLLAEIESTLNFFKI